MIAVLALVGFLAGFVDSIAGGGGLVTLPALLAFGLDPRVALATNKGQAIFGAASSVGLYARSGALDRRRAPWSFLAAGLGSFLGARLLLVLRPDVLRPVVLVLLVGAAIAVLVRKKAGTEPVALVVRAPIVCALIVGLLLGAYDGFFGPGVGTFLIVVYATFFGDTLVAASANAKVANFASNLLAFLVFAFAGAIRWEIAIPMGLAQIAGAFVGTRLALKRGAGLVRAVTVTISLALAARVAYQLFSGR